MSVISDSRTSPPPSPTSTLVDPTTETASEDSSFTTAELTVTKICGRQYPLDAFSVSPIDASAMEHMEKAHGAHLEANDNRLCAAPIPEKAKVWDVGTGLGEWAIQIASLHADAIVLGTDVVPIQPDIVPPNITFLVSNVNTSLPGNDYDLIHARDVDSIFEDVDATFRGFRSCLKVGGYLEVVNTSLGCKSENKENKTWLKWQRCLADLIKTEGRSFAIGHQPTRKAMKNAGFEIDELFTKDRKIPLDPTWKSVFIDRICGLATRVATSPETVTLQEEEVGAALATGEFFIEYSVLVGKRGVGEPPARTLSSPPPRRKRRACFCF